MKLLLAAFVGMIVLLISAACGAYPLYGHQHAQFGGDNRGAGCRAPAVLYGGGDVQCPAEKLSSGAPNVGYLYTSYVGKILPGGKI